MITGKTQTDFTEDKEVKIKRQILKHNVKDVLSIQEVWSEISSTKMYRTFL